MKALIGYHWSRTFALEVTTRVIRALGLPGVRREGDGPRQLGACPR